jgi:hypothetical protein
VSFTLGISQDIPDFITICDFLERDYVIVCWVDELATYPRMVIKFFLHQHSLYIILADPVHLQILMKM